MQFSLSGRSPLERTWRGVVYTDDPAALAVTLAGMVTNVYSSVDDPFGGSAYDDVKVMEAAVALTQKIASPPASSDYRCEVELRLARLS